LGKGGEKEGYSRGKNIATKMRTASGEKESRGRKDSTEGNGKSKKESSGIMERGNTSGGKKKEQGRKKNKKRAPLFLKKGTSTCKKKRAECRLPAKCGGKGTHCLRKGVTGSPMRIPKRN